MNIKQYTLLLLLFFIQTAPAQNFSYLRTTIDNDTISNKKEEYRDSMDSRWWAGLGTGIYFSNQDRFYQRMIIILTSEYRLENIPSLLFEAQWWNSNKGEKKSFVLSGGIKLRLYMGEHNFFVIGEIGYATSFPINTPVGIGSEFSLSKKVRISLQVRTGLSNGELSPYFLVLSFIKSN